MQSVSVLSNTTTKAVNGSTPESFEAMLGKQLQKVEEAQVRANDLTQSLVAGENVDLHTVLIATEEARLSLEMTIQVRNKIIDAYKEIMNMQI
jgi:flagellar hook-basal body complex protein FliE